MTAPSRSKCVIRLGSFIQPTSLRWQRWPDLPILFISAYPEPALHDRGAEALVQDFLCKPFTREQLMMALTRLLPAHPVG